jgi:ParB family chromosome partitioning protein
MAHWRGEPTGECNCQRGKTPTQAKLVAKRKAAYEAVHPETRNGASGRGRGKVSQVGKASDSFTVDTAVKSGRPRTAVARDATRAKALGTDLDRVAQTFLDKGAELDGLANLPIFDACR